MSRSTFLLDRWFLYGVKQEQRGITRRLIVCSALFGVVMVADLTVVAHVREGTWLSAVALGGLGAALGWAALQPAHGRQAWRRGYLHGRAAMLASMVEAGERGLSGQEWYLAEMERDFGSLTSALGHVDHSEHEGAEEP